MAAPAGSQHYQVSSPLLFPFRRHCETATLLLRDRQAPIRSHHPHSILEEDEGQEGGEDEDEDEGGVLPQMEYFGKQTGRGGGGGGLVDERLRALLMLLNQSNGTGDDASAVDADHEDDGIRPKEDTLQYLSQLESMARRLKDQLLMDQPKVSLAQAMSHRFLETWMPFQWHPSRMRER